MELISFENAEVVNNSDKCQVREYSFNNKDIDACIATINGRYPDKGYSVNRVSKEVIYIMDGEGLLYLNKDVYSIKKGDAILIDINELYYFDTKFMIMEICSNPAWNSNQYEIVEEL